MPSYMDAEKLMAWHLDYVIAKRIFGYAISRTTRARQTIHVTYSGVGHNDLEFSPTTRWVDGGPLIQNYGLSIVQNDAGIWTCTSQEGISHQDESPLIAAMRVLISSKVKPPYEIPS